MSESHLPNHEREAVTELTSEKASPLVGSDFWHLQPIEWVRVPCDLIDLVVIPGDTRYVVTTLDGRFLSSDSARSFTDRRRCLLRDRPARVSYSEETDPA